MGNWIYNTDHSSFLLPKSKINSAADALWVFLKERGETFDPELEGEDLFERALKLLDLEYSENSDGNIIDIYLGGNSWDDNLEKALEKIIAPYVQDGSYLVFWGGGADGVWGVQYKKNHETDLVEGHACDFDTVIHEDVDRILDVLKGTNRALYLEMKQKYRPKHGESNGG